MDTLVNIGLIVTYIAFFLSIILIVGFSLIQFIQTFKQSKVQLIGIVVLLLIFVISYLASSSTDVSKELFEKTGTNYAYSRLIGSALISLYILSVITILAIIYTQISNFIKK